MLPFVVIVCQDDCFVWSVKMVVEEKEKEGVVNGGVWCLCLWWHLGTFLCPGWTLGSLVFMNTRISCGIRGYYLFGTHNS